MTISAAHRIIVSQQRQQPTRVPNFHQLKLLQVWQSWRLADVLAACHEYGFTGILVKALDGTNWMSSFDSSSDAVGSIEELERHALQAHTEGLYCFAWTNPLASPGSNDLALEATLTGQVARACDGVFLDVEPYAQFWGIQPEGVATQFMRWVRAEAPNAFVALQPDPRPARLGDIRVWEWIPFCDALAGQHYWSDFGTVATAELSYARELASVYGVPVLPTLPGNAPLSSFPLEQIALSPGFVLWRYGSTPQAALELIGSARVGGFSSGRIRPQ